MPMTWNNPDPELERRAGQLLIVAAITIESELQTKLSRSYPPASKRGEYPARRTGNLMNSPMHLPEPVAEVGKAGQLRMGWADSEIASCRLKIKISFFILCSSCFKFGCKYNYYLKFVCYLLLPLRNNFGSGVA